MAKKKRFEYAIGFDECLNGFKVGDNHHPFMVMVGYLGKDGRGYGTRPFGSKANRKFFGRKRSTLDEVLRCAIPFLQKHNCYRYIVIPEKKITSPEQLYYRKAECVARISTMFFEAVPRLTPENTVLYIDETDGKLNSDYLNIVLDYLLEDTPLASVKHRSICNGENSKEVIKMADMIAYYLASIRLLSQSKRWPHKTKRLHL